jgi:hypothetical protein
MTTTPTSTNNKTMKVKRLKEGGFCVILFWGGGGGGWFCNGFFLSFCQAHFFFNHQESGYYLQIKHNIRFLSQKEKLCHDLGFSWFLS